MMRFVVVVGEEDGEGRSVDEGDGTILKDE